MSKLLPTRLPISFSPQVESDTYNRLVRVLEINLGRFDPDNTRQITTSERNTLYFDPGSLIWNTTINTLQVFDGNNWISLSQELPYTTDPLEAQGQVGSVQVINAGAIVVSVGS